MKENEMTGKRYFSIYTLLVFILLGGASCASESAKKERGAKTAVAQAVEIQEPEVEEIEDISGPMTITGKFKHTKAVEGQWVKLYETEGKDRFLMDSALIENGLYTFELENVEIGLYRIGLSKVEKAQGEIILNPNEKDIQINYDRHNFLNYLSYTNSPENTAWMAYRTERDKYNADLKAVRKSGETRDVKLQKILARNKKFDILQGKLAVANPNTFFGKTVRRFQSPRLNDRDHYWDDIDFTDESLIHSTVLNDRLMTYYQTHAKKENTDSDKYKGFYNCTDRLANEIKDRGTGPMLEFMLYIASEGFYKSGMEDVSHYVIELTLVLFWASFCEHCKSEIPELMTFYPQYEKKGFEVIGVSVDANKNSWKKGITDLGASYINVSELTSWGGPVLKKYRVTKTPAMFLVDKNGTLVQRPKSVAELKRFLSKKLG